ncbi:NUDIX hydrolase [Mycetocola spongiae]|uniref:NUDIX hydrolase n=1 Tax=Mycetocola spongiae TaxID=2859226 RepID=UPI001CF57CA7|nr:NUDIX hydrolase [Mycetocola spongiae]UCR90114.1 NUDIX hydrolase [Mycetocola spongiae]
MAFVESWKKTSSVSAYEGYVTIRRDTYREPDSTLSDWDIIAGADSVAVLAFTPGDHSFIIFEQFRAGPERILQELPGGYLNSGERPVQAGLRELREETGFESHTFFDAGGEWWAANSSRRKHLLIVADARRVAEPHWDASERGRIGILPFAELRDFLLAGDLTDAGLACRGLLRFAHSNPTDSELLSLRDHVQGLLSRD